MTLLFRHGKRVRIEEMSQCGISPYKNNLLEGFAETTLLQKPKETLDGHIHNAGGTFLAGRAMDDVGDPSHGSAHYLPVGDASFHNLKPLLRFRQTVVTESAKRYTAMTFGLQDATDKMGAHFTGSASHQDVLH